MGNVLVQQEYIDIEIVYAEANKQMVISQQISGGTTLAKAVAQSEIMQKINSNNKDELKFGIFGVLVANPDEYILKSGDRIEIYRQLTIDPKQIRKKRLERLKKL